MLQILGVQVGAVQALEVGEQRVMSGIRKRAVHGPVAVEVPGSVVAGQAFEVVAGPRETPLIALFRTVQSRHS